MSYELSFSPEFFYEHSDFPEVTETPCSVYESLHNFSVLDQITFNEMVKEVLGYDLVIKEVFDFGIGAYTYYPENIIFDLIEKVKEYNECKNLNTPVEVCINENYSVKVY
jgi:hypothetical protein